ncbi:MAG: LysR family transcriptional regulator [Oscillospiraceae bacterium]|nr:LysR family transcriptional regulator [Oscillospiraceae bacterium]
MTLQQMKYALTISEEGSMNKAAEKLFISQPSLTSAVRELEKEIGIQVFVRSSRGVSVTAEGADFLMYVRQVYQQYELLRQKYGESGGARRKFGVSTQHYSFAVKAFVEMVKNFGTLNFEFAIRETRTMDVLKDVGGFRSEVGIIYRCDYNRKIIGKILHELELEFFPLINCRAYVYLWKNHPLANEKSIGLEQLVDYPCLVFEQGEGSSGFLAEEILTDNDYPRMIRSTDRATQLNLMVGLNGYTLCSGIICEELNGSEYRAVPFREDERNRNTLMEIGYVMKKHSILSDIGEVYISEVKRYLQGCNGVEEQ